MTLYGSNFTGATRLLLGSTVVNFTVLSSTVINAGVPVGAHTGDRFTLTTPAGEATSAGAITIDSTAGTVLALTLFLPTAGPAGTSVTLSGSAFGNAQGTVFFNGQAATVSSWSDTQIVALAPPAGTGKIKVTTTAGASVTSQSDFLLSEAGDYAIDTAVWGQQALIELRGFVEEDEDFSDLSPALTIDGSDTAEVVLAYEAPFAVTLPHFGLQLAINHTFGVGPDGGPQNFVRCVYYLENGEEMGFQFEGNTDLYRYYQKLNGQDVLFNFYTRDRYNGGNSGLPVAPPYTYLGFTFSHLSWCLLNPQAGQENTVWDHCELDGNPSYDFRLPEKLDVIKGVRIYVGRGGNGGKQLSLGSLRYGYLKGVGSANYAPCTWGDGGTMQDGQNMLLGCSIAHPAANNSQDDFGANCGIQSAQASVLKVDLLNNTVKPWAKFGFLRKLANGRTYVMGDNSIDIGEDPQTGQLYGFASTWATFRVAGEAPVEPIAYPLGTTIPKGAVRLPKGIKLNLPSPDGGFTQDSDWLYFNGLYYLVYNTNYNQVFTIRLVSSPYPLGDQSQTNPNKRWTLVGSSAGSLVGPLPAGAQGHAPA